MLKPNQKGFSIMQVVVAMSVMSFMGAGLSTMISNQTNQVFYLEDIMSQQNFKRELETLLLDTTVCSESLKDVQIPKNLASVAPVSGTTFVIKNSAGDVLYDLDNNTKNKFENLKISNIKVQNKNITDPLVGGDVQLVVDLIRERSASKQPLKSIIISKSVSVDPTLKVVSCIGSSGSGSAWGECLDNIGGANFGSTGSNNYGFSVNVPANAKAMEISLPGDKCPSGTGYSSNYKNDGAGFLLLPLNGSITYGGKKFVGGGKLTLTPTGNAKVFALNYMDVRIGYSGHCTSNTNITKRDSFDLKSSTLPVCRKPADFVHRTESGSLMGAAIFSLFGMSGGSTNHGGSVAFFD